MNLARYVALVTALYLVKIMSTSAQSGGGHIGLSNAEVAGAAVGLAAVTGVVLYLALHNPSIRGCLRSVEGTNILTNENDSLTYKLIDGPQNSIRESESSCRARSKGTNLAIFPFE